MSASTSGSAFTRVAALIVDDEPMAIARLERLLVPHGRFEVVARAGCAAEARRILASAGEPGQPETIDVVFLDVEMPGESGLEVLASVPRETAVVFVTAFTHYALQAFDSGAVDYLLKPADPERLEQTLERVLRLLPLLREETEGHDDPDTPPESPADPAATTLQIPLVGRGGTRPLEVADICWIEGMRNYSRVALHGVPRPLVFRRRLVDWQADLPAATFARISKSLIVNVARLAGSRWQCRDETLLTFHGQDDSLTIGRLAASRLREILGRAPDGY